jgi:microtubule-associated protein-like 6
MEALQYIRQRSDDINISKKMFTLSQLQDAQQLLRIKDRNEQIGVIKFSPNGKYLAVGSNDNFVDIYETIKFQRLGICTGNSSFITHLDWSQDSKFIRTNSGSYEELYFAIPNCKHSPSRPAVDWNTWTCVLGSNVEGIWPPYSDKTDVNCCDRSPDNSLLVTGDDFGGVKLFPFPVKKGSPFTRFGGHSAHVTCVRWTNDQKFVISTGGGDQAVFQWRVVEGKVDDPEDQVILFSKINIT